MMALPASAYVFLVDCRETSFNYSLKQRTQSQCKGILELQEVLIREQCGNSWVLLWMKIGISPILMSLTTMEMVPRTDIIFFCLPNNPTGSAASREQLTKLVQFAKDNGSILVCTSFNDASNIAQAGGLACLSHL